MSRAPVVVKNSEELLRAEEGQMVVDEDKREPSPIEQHMKARGDVNPKKINRKNNFSKTVEDSHAKDKSNYRVVRVEGDTSIGEEMQPKGLKIEPDPIAKQAHAKSYVQAILDKHQARQEGEKEVPQKVSQKASKKVQADISVSQSSVQGLRIGQHPGKTRIVLDVSGKATFQTSFESGNKVLVVRLPNASWATEPKTKVNGNSLVLGYDADDYKSGSVVKISLGAPGRLAYQKALKPSGERGHRIVLDVVAR